MTAEPASSPPPGDGAPPVERRGAPAQPTPAPPAPPAPAAGAPGGHPPQHPPHRPHPEQRPRGKRLAILSLTALGVVYGDIGTSPLYALRECFSGEHSIAPTVANVYGVLSILVWALIFVVSVKYLVFIVRADNRGEGGTLALLALILQRQHRAEEQRRRALLIALGLFGAALLFGEGIITPAISVLGAVEGLELAAPAFSHFVVPLAAGILLLLFLFQRHGTARVGGVFGPVMLLWFLTIAALGVREIARAPEILLAVNPWFAVRFALENGAVAFFILGSVVLVITGAEALYADLGHFGRRPMRVAWFGLALPCLLLNYFGQGALVLRAPEAAINPFYLLAPGYFLIPLILIATAAAIIASQALISGSFSIMQQGVQLGYIPRITIVHTSARQYGQIYVPEVNKALMVGCLLLVVSFGSASALAAAYGIAVTGTMSITSVLFFVVARFRWQWPLWRAAGLTLAFLAVDLSFFSANLVKLGDGGWVPLALAVVVFTLMTTWKRGRACLGEILERASLPMELFLDDVERRQPHRVPGTAVFMTSDASGAPVVLLHHVKHNKVLHEQVLLMSILSAEVPEVPDEEKVHIEPLGQGFYRVRATFGFMETPDVPEILEFCAEQGLHRVRPQEVSFYLGRERLLATGGSPMARWRKKLFAFLSRNARSATEFFGIPPNRVVELGTQLEF